MRQKPEMFARQLALASICLGVFVVYGSYLAGISPLIKKNDTPPNGQAESDYQLAIQYAAGEGVEQNMDKAIALITQSAERGFSDAQFMLGDVYYHGIPSQHHHQNFHQNYSQAYIWFSLAADGGSVKAPLLRYEVAAFLSPAELMAAQQVVASYRAKKASYNQGHR